MKLDKNSSLHFEQETSTGTKIVIDYTRYFDNDCYKKHMLEMFLLLTNWKSNKGYYVLDFETVYDTNKLVIYVDCDEEIAKEMISHFNYYDYNNVYSKEEEKDFLLLDVLDCENIKVFKVYKDDEDFEDFVLDVASYI